MSVSRYLYSTEERGRAHLPLLLLVFVFTALTGVLGAQSNSEEYSQVKSYILPPTAVPISETTMDGDLHLREGKAFSGLVYERFANGRLSRVLSLVKGLQQGPTYLWYPDGNPQMSANYRGGKLQGRFLGWYANGGIIYDMVINNGAYAGDYIEDDGARGLADSADTEGEGNELDMEKD